MYVRESNEGIFWVGPAANLFPRRIVHIIWKTFTVTSSHYKQLQTLTGRWSISVYSNYLNYAMPYCATLLPSVHAMKNNCGHQTTSYNFSFILVYLCGVASLEILCIGVKHGGVHLEN